MFLGSGSWEQSLRQVWIHVTCRREDTPGETYQESGRKQDGEEAKLISRGRDFSWSLASAWSFQDLWLVSYIMRLTLLGNYVSRLTLGWWGTVSFNARRPSFWPRAAAQMRGWHSFMDRCNGHLEVWTVCRGVEKDQAVYLYPIFISFYTVCISSFLSILCYFLPFFILPSPFPLPPSPLSTSPMFLEHIT